MICNIILRIPGRMPEIIYTNSNFNEIVNEFENIALDDVSRLGGEDSRVVISRYQLSRVTRGFYCVADLNKFSIYRKEKNGWYFPAEPKLLKEFELISYKTNRILPKIRNSKKFFRDEEILRINEVFHNQIEQKDHPLLSDVAPSTRVCCE